jgi:hypothetical protein
MGVRLVLVAAAVAGSCGRVGFDPRDGAGATDDGPGLADAAPCTIAPDIRISSAVGRSDRPVIGWNGTGYGLAWNDTHDGNYEIYFAPVDAGGTVGPATRVTTTGVDSTWPTIAWSGESYGVLWAEAGPQQASTIMFQELDAAGATLSGPLQLRTLTSGFVPIRTQRWPGGLLQAVAWQADPGTGDEIFFDQILRTGQSPIGETRVTNAAGASGFPSLAYNGTDFGVAWNDDRDGNPEIYFAHVNTSGAPVGPDVRVTTAQGSSFAPTIEWTGSHYAVTWWDDRSGTAEMYFAALGLEGARIGDEIELTPGQYSQAGTARWSGRELGVVWFDFRNGVLEPYFARFAADGRRLGDDVRVSTGGVDVDPESLDLIWAGGRFAIAFADAREGQNEVYLAFVSCP